jgi:hypothetical protein
MSPEAFVEAALAEWRQRGTITGPTVLDSWTLPDIEHAVAAIEAVDPAAAAYLVGAREVVRPEPAGDVEARRLRDQADPATERAFGELTAADVIGPDLPNGLRLWTAADSRRSFPVLDPIAYHGPIGEYLVVTAGQTEAHPAAIGAELLAHCGLMIGRNVAASMGQHRHPPALFVAIVGASLTGAKGTASTTARYLLDLVDPNHRRRHDITGAASGESVIYQLRDPKDDDDQDGARSRHRIMADAELGAMLTAAGRDGSILSETLRKAWDREPLRHESRTHGASTATDYMLSIVGSITSHELRASLSALDFRNGFGNRLLYVHAHAVERLPFGGDIDRDRIEPIAADITSAIERAQQRPRTDGRTLYHLTTDARDLWADWYHRNKDRAEAAGEYARPSVHLTVRAIPYTLRVALILTVLDQADMIGPAQLRAAMAWVRYGIATAEHVFDNHATGDTGVLLEALRDTGSAGISLTEISDLFHRNRTRGELEELRSELTDRALAVEIKRPPVSGRGRPIVRLYATAPLDRSGGAGHELTK